MISQAFYNNSFFYGGRNYFPPHFQISTVSFPNIEKEILTEEITIRIGSKQLSGILSIPYKATKLVVFSHGSGSSRFSTRNNKVAETINNHGIATLLFDLLTPEEDSITENRFDIVLLSKRLIEVTNWLNQYKSTEDLSIGYFGASTGAASALNAAALLGSKIKAVVSRGGRPDLAMHQLPNVLSPVLLLVGELDPKVITMNEQAFEKLRCKKELKIISGASHLFEETGKLNEVAELAANWFNLYLR